MSGTAGARHREGDTAGAQRTAGTALLTVGYVMTVGTGATLRRTFRERRTASFVAFEVGTACVVAGWALRRRRFRALVNAGFLAGTALAWTVARN